MHPYVRGVALKKVHFAEFTALFLELFTKMQTKNGCFGGILKNICLKMARFGLLLSNFVQNAHFNLKYIRKFSVLYNA